MKAKVLPEMGTQNSGGAAHPDGAVVDVVLQSIVPRTIRWTDKQTGAPQERDVWEWTFEAKGTDAWIRGITPPGLRGRNVTRAWCEALVGELPDGFEFDTDSLISLSCRVKVKHGKPYKSRRTGKTVTPLEVAEVYPESV